jgi:hypothetical protein
VVVVVVVVVVVDEVHRRTDREVQRGIRCIALLPL